jgi:hypothetical protein
MNTFFHPIICEGFYDVVIALSSGAPTFFAVLFLGYLMVQTRHDMKVGFAKADNDMKAGFARVDSDMKAGFEKADHKLESVRGELRDEMNEGFAKLRSEITEVRSEIKDVRFEIKELALKTDHRFEKNEVRIESLERHDQTSKSKPE